MSSPTSMPLIPRFINSCLDINGVFQGTNESGFIQHLNTLKPNPRVSTWFCCSHQTPNSIYIPHKFKDRGVFNFSSCNIISYHIVTGQHLVCWLIHGSTKLSWIYIYIYIVTCFLNSWIGFFFFSWEWRQHISLFVGIWRTDLYPPLSNTKIPAPMNNTLGWILIRKTIGYSQSLLNTRMYEESVQMNG